MYRGVDLGFGGYVYSEPGIYSNVALLDIQSMHPHSAIAMNYFGDYTPRYKEIMDARIAIKNGDYETAKKMFDGKIAKYLDDETMADQLATALKLVINACYGLSSASFENPFRDSRNVNNIIALRGALFMKTLKDRIVEEGYRVVAIRTDSIKIPNADNHIISLCMDMAKEYGYTFEHEATYERMCLVDKANYIAAYMKPEDCETLYGRVPKDNMKHFKKHTHPWTTTGDNFQKPYIFKTLFSGEPIEFKDVCKVASVQNAAIYLDMNEGYPNVESEEAEMDARRFNEEAEEGAKKRKLNPKYASLSDDELKAIIAKGHNYQFIGRVSSFYPVKDGCGGGLMRAYRNGKYSYISGTKGYRWLESDVVKILGKEKDLDNRYFDAEIDEAIAAINKYGDFDRFINTSVPYECAPKVDDENTRDDDPPFDLVPCGDNKYHTCLDCPECKGDVCKKGYSLNSFIERGGEEA